MKQLPVHPLLLLFQCIGALGAVAVHVVVRFTSTVKDCVTPPRVTEILKLPVLGVGALLSEFQLLHCFLAFYHPLMIFCKTK